MARTSVTRRKAKPSHPAAATSNDLLVQAAHLLNVGATALVAHADEDTGRPAPAAIQAIVQAARRAVEQWCDGHNETAPRNVFQALSLLMLMDAALATPVAVFNSIYCDPILNGMEIAQDLLERDMDLSAREAA